ncbi:MAG: DUF2093 domain-containing protein [Rhodobiaceae bacterium]|nr:DUF2093 domain-containing protein [Rhodobiaceae bacterium]
MNRFENSFNVQGEARLRYGDGDFEILTPGTFVRCAVSGQPIPLDELRYWSIPLQEPYATPEASLKRYRETASGAGAD